MRTIVTVVIMAAAILVVGCSEQSDASKKRQAGSQKPRTVVVSEGMSKEEEEKLNERLAALEEKVDDRSAEEQQPTQETGSADETASAEDPARAAAQAYYSAAATGNFSYTYNELSSYSRSQFGEDEWVAANTALGSDTASYGIDSVDMVDDSTAEVRLTVTLPDGSSSGRITRFILESGSWKHDLTQEEYDLFASADGNAASASASAAASAQYVENPGSDQYQSLDPESRSDHDSDRDHLEQNRRSSTDPSSAPTSGDGISYPPVSEDDCPANAPIKGNEQSGIYHEPNGAYYDVTNPEECFATAADAEEAGYRASER